MVNTRSDQEGKESSRKTTGTGETNTTCTGGSTITTRTGESSATCTFETGTTTCTGRTRYTTCTGETGNTTCTGETTTGAGDKSGVQSTPAASTATFVDRRSEINMPLPPSAAENLPKPARSRRSAASRKRLLAELEAKERLAELELKQLQAAAALERARLLRIEAESDDSTGGESDDLAPSRVSDWFDRQPALEPRLSESQKEVSAPAVIRAAIEEPIPRCRRGQGARVSHTHGQREPQEAPPARQASPIDVTSLAAALREAIQTSSRHTRRHLEELPLFSGHSHEWLSFKAAFDETEGSFTTGENYARLRKSLRGAALEAVSALLISKPAPQAIIESLQRRFGRPDALLMGEMEKLKTLPRLTESPRDVCVFANRVANAVATVELLQRPHYLHNPEILRLIIEKLTPILRNKWYDYAADNTDAPELKKIAEFLNREADKCAAYAPPEAAPDHGAPRRKTERAHAATAACAQPDAAPEHATRRKTERAYAATAACARTEAAPEHATRRRTERSPAAFAATTVSRKSQLDKCPACGESHQLPTCPQFIRADTHKRWEITKRANICFRCLVSKHRRLDCRAKHCGHDGCTMRHHRLLHHERAPLAATAAPHRQPDKSEEIVASATVAASTYGRRAYLKIAPVVLRGPQASVATYALLDEGSTVTLIDEALANTLGLKGPTEALLVQGVSGTEIAHNGSKRVSVAIRGRHSAVELTVNNARTVARLDFTSQSIGEREIEDCAHLRQISSQLLYDNATPKILIGQDNWELIVTQKMREGRRDQLVASKTRLGWVLHGCRSSTAAPMAYCSHLTRAEKHKKKVASAHPGRSEEATAVPIGGSEIEKTLGLLWDTRRDCLSFCLNTRRAPPEVFDDLRPPTKREALSVIMSISDPLGLISPITTPAKRIMQDEWRWLPSAENAADDATRATPADFDSHHRWYTGPRFLYLQEDAWPTENRVEIAATGEEKEKCLVAIVASDHAHLPIIERFSRWTRLLRATARVLQFVERCRHRTQTVAAARRKKTKANATKDPEWRKHEPHKTKPTKSAAPVLERDRIISLEAHHLKRAELLWVRAAQGDSYAAEIRRLQNNEPPPKSDRLAALSVYLDDDGVARLKSRIEAADAIQEETASPVLLHGTHRYTRLYIQHVHEKLHHGGTEITVNELRQRIHIMKIRPAVKEVIARCVPCRLKKAKPPSPSTGDLPAARLAHHVRPFSYTGLDYFGPLEVTVGRHREKRYIALFTCMTSRAVHLEVAASLSTDSAIAALRRFIARRGCPTELWSDNATSFHGADHELTNAIKGEAAGRQIAWRFLPPAAPFMAGAWERMVRTVKEALRATLHEKYPSDETLATLLAEVEATVNSRPLTHVAVAPEDPPALTPNMLLIGPNCHVPAPGAFKDRDITARQHWRRAQRLADIFWQRWVREYMPLLQNRREPHSSGASPAEGDVVIVCDSNLPRNTWPRGRITRTYPGKDGVVRVVDVTTSHGHILRRPSKKIVVLPVGSRSDGGRNVHDGILG